MNVLITDADYKQSLSMARSLASKGIRVTLATHDPKAPALYSRFCSRKLILPDPLVRKEDYISALLSDLKQHTQDLLITLRDETTEYLSESRASFAQLTKFCLPSADVVRMCLNKHEMFRFALERGIPIPQTRFVNSEEEIDAALRDFTFPVVVKFPRGGAGSGNRYCGTSDEVHEAYRSLIRENSTSSLKPMIQQFIQGRHLDFHAVCCNGEILEFFQFTKIRAYPISGGNGAKCISIYLPQLLDVCRRICREINYHGVVNIDLMEDAHTKEIYLLEVNPRFGGLTPMAIRAGADTPFALWKMAVSGEQLEPSRYKEGMVFRSLFYDELRYALDAPRSIPRLLAEFLDWRITYDVVFSDLCPLYRQLRESWRIILQKLMSHRAQPAGPTVSVIMRSFNHAGYISHAIDSVLNQTITDLELIIVDDASRDRSQEIIRAIGNRDNRIKTILHSSNRGMAAGMNEGMAASTGKFIAFIDSDDIWERDKLEKQLEYLNRQTDCAAVWTEGRIINEQGVPTGETFTDIRWGKKRQKNGDLLHELVNGNFILLSSFLGKAKAVKAHPFWTELRYFNDWAFHFEMSLKHRYAFIPEPLTRYRVHAQSTQQDANGYRNDWIKTHALFLRKFARQLSTCQRSYLYFKMGELSREKGCWFRSCRYMLTAYRVDRSNSDALYCLSTTIKSRFPVLYRIARILMRRGASS